MNDDELITVVRESFTGVHSSTPVGQVVRRSRAMRARRRIPGLAGALAAAAGAAAAVAAVLPASGQPGNPPGHQPSARPAAWTVTRQANGTIYVTIRELRDPAGLQRKLRADGVPASVTFLNPHNPWPRLCRRYSKASAGLTDRVIQAYQGNGRRGTALVIHPSALPGDAGVLISAWGHGPAEVVVVSVVQASRGCTG
jgi:hypothetical protein